MYKSSGPSSSGDLRHVKTRRPSLGPVAAGKSTKRVDHDDGPMSILAAIDGESSPSRNAAAPRQRNAKKGLWRLLACALLAAGGWAAWQTGWLTGSSGPPLAAHGVAEGQSSAPTDAKAALPVLAASAPLAAESMAEHAVSTPAVVENLPALADAAPTPGSGGLAGLEASSEAPARAASASAVASAAHPLAFAGAAAKPSSAGKVAGKTAPKSAVSPARHEATRKAGNAGSKDADVDLIAALMRHADPTAAGHPNEAKPFSEVSIAGLVARCNTQPGPEAKACQRRICDGYWGRADACPARLAPKPAASAKHSEVAAQR